MDKQNIRIHLRAYDNKILDLSTIEIVNTAKRTGAQAQRRATRSPGGFAGGGTVESYSAQVQRKYGGGKV